MESGRHGLFPHDLAREVIDADLRWRDPAAYGHVHEHVRADVVERLQGDRGARAAARARRPDVPAPRQPGRAARSGTGRAWARSTPTRCAPGDRDAIAAMVERHEGAESAAIAAHWLERQPAAFAASAGAAPSRSASSPSSRCTPPREQDSPRDPGARARGRTRNATLRRGPATRCSPARFFDGPRCLPGAVAVVQRLTMLQHPGVAGRPRLSWYYLAVRRPGRGRAAHGLHRLRARARRRLRGRRPPLRRVRARLAPRARRASGSTDGRARARRRAARAAAAPRPALALSQPEFAAAVRGALRALHRPGALAANPLLARARGARPREGAAADALRALIERGGRRAARRPARRQARARARAHLPPPGADAGGGGRAARAAVQHLPRPPDARRRARRRLALAARAVRPGQLMGSNSAEIRLESRQPGGGRCARTRRPGGGAMRRIGEHAVVIGGEHRRAAGGPRADRRLRAGHGDRPRRAPAGVEGRRAVPQGRHAHALLPQRPGVPRRAAAGVQRRAGGRRRGDVRGARRDALR